MRKLIDLSEDVGSVLIIGYLSIWIYYGILDYIDNRRFWKQVQKRFDEMEKERNEHFKKALEATIPFMVDIIQNKSKHDEGTDTNRKARKTT